MNFLVTSNLAAAILLFLLVLSGSSMGFRRLLVMQKKRRKFVVLEVPNDKAKDLKKLLTAVTPPFTLEVAVSQLGKDKSFYITLPAGRAGSVESALGAKRVNDYELYYPGGTVLGGYATGDDAVEDVNPDSIDFGAVNEIGEGAVVQLVFSKKRKGEFLANVRTLVSAPSSYQAKEIISKIKKSLDHVKFTEVKSEDFIDSVNSRDFNEKELIRLSL